MDERAGHPFGVGPARHADAWCFDDRNFGHAMCLTCIYIYVSTACYLYVFVFEMMRHLFFLPTKQHGKCIHQPNLLGQIWGHFWPVLAILI